MVLWIGNPPASIPYPIPRQQRYLRFCAMFGHILPRVRKKPNFLSTLGTSCPLIENKNHAVRKLLEKLRTLVLAQQSIQCDIFEDNLVSYFILFQDASIRQDIQILHSRIPDNP